MPSASIHNPQVIDKDQIEEGAPGQFDDAPSENVTNEVTQDLSALSLAPTYDPRQGNAFIDEALGDEWSSSDEDDYEEDSGNEAAVWEDSVARVDDEDWEIADRGGYAIPIILTSTIILIPASSKTLPSHIIGSDNMSP